MPLKHRIHQVLFSPIAATEFGGAVIILNQPLSLVGFYCECPDALKFGVY